MNTLSTDPATGQPLINGQPATPEQVREVLHEAGYWYEGEYVTYAEKGEQ